MGNLPLPSAVRRLRSTIGDCFAAEACASAAWWAARNDSRGESGLSGWFLSAERASMRSAETHKSTVDKPIARTNQIFRHALRLRHFLKESFAPLKAKIRDAAGENTHPVLLLLTFVLKV